MPLQRTFLSALFVILPSTLAFGQVGFTTHTFTESGGGVSPQLRAADLNHDGFADLVSGDGVVYLSDGMGSFTPGSTLKPEGGFIDLQVADLNGDGAPDIVACSEAESRYGNFYYLYTFLNDGSGGFSAATTTLSVNGCANVVVGDATGDGKPDVAIGYSNAGASGNPAASNTVQIYPGLGNGKLGTPMTQANIDFNVPQQGPVYSNCFLTNLVGGKFDGGNLSILVNTTCVEPQGSTEPGSYSTTFLGRSYGEGKFTFSEQGAHPWTYLGGRTADLNDDGMLDVLFFDQEFVQYAGSALYALLNQGGGDFKVSNLPNAQGTKTAEAYYTGVATADLNGDGILDIATINENAGNSGGQGTTVNILAGTGKGQFTSSQSWTANATTSPSGDIVSADFNGDGKPDLAAVTSPGTVSVYLNTMGTATRCTAPSTANSSVICSPASGASEASPVTVTAASNVTGFTLNRLYLDNVSVYQLDSQTISTPVQASAGTHTLVLVSYNNKGQAFTASRTFTITAGGGSGCLPSSAGVNICSPASGGYVSTGPSSPITLQAGALTTSGYITAIRFYEDDAAIATMYNPGKTPSYQGTTAGLVTGGAHTLKVVAYTSTGAALTRSEPFNVYLTGNCLPPGAGAVICSPVQNQIVPTTFSVSLGAQVTSGSLTAVQLYVDNEANFFTIAGPSYYTGTAQVNLAPGSHRLVLVGYSSTGANYTASTTVTVQ